MSVGAYLACFNQLTASAEVIRAYRHHYPTSTLLLVNDAGDKRHQAIAEKYNCTYFYEDVNIGYPGEQPHYRQIIRWTHRFLNYVKTFSEPWFVLLEDDVLVMKPVTEATLNFDINGINPQNLLPVPSTRQIQAKGYHPGVHRLMYGAMGGAIFRTSFFRDLANRWEEVETAMVAFGEACPPTLTGQNWYYSDVILSHLCYFFGGTLGQYPEFAELWFVDLGRRLEENRVAVLNQYKHLYDFPPHLHLTRFRPRTLTVVMHLETVPSDLARTLNQYNEFSSAEQCWILVADSEIGAVRACIPTRGQLEFRVLSESAIYTQTEIAIDSPKIGPNAGAIDGSEMNLPDVLEMLAPKSKPISKSSSKFLPTKRFPPWVYQLAICSQIETEYYLIVNPSESLISGLEHFLTSENRIRYRPEAWAGTISPPTKESTQTVREWAHASILSKIPVAALAATRNLMSISTPQLFVTSIVHQMLHDLGDGFASAMEAHPTSGICLYWIWIHKTLRYPYYIAVA